MSWLKGYTNPKPSTSAEDSREEKRKKLEADRLQRVQQREQRQKQLQRALESQREAEQVLQDLLNIDPELFADIDDIEVNSNVDIEDIPDIMAEAFDVENGTDSEKALDKLHSIKVPFDKEDIEFWFSELEGQLEVIGVKSQWLKRIALQQFLPVEIRTEVKSLLKLTKANCGTDIYKKIKGELMDLFGQKPEDAYVKAKNRVMTGKPSQLGKALLEDLCKKDKKLDGCCCSNIVWGMYREALPVVVRNHIAEMPFNKDSFKDVFTKSDQVFDSNKASDNSSRPVASVSTPATAQSEVAAVQGQSKNKGQNNKNKNKNKGQGQGKNNGQSGGQKNGQGEAATKTPINDDGHCRIHAKWKENATFCAAPWGCKMKNVYKAPQ